MARSLVLLLVLLLGGGPSVDAACQAWCGDTADAAAGDVENCHAARPDAGAAAHLVPVAALRCAHLGAPAAIVPDVRPGVQPAASVLASTGAILIEPGRLASPARSSRGSPPGVPSVPRPSVLRI